MSGSSEIRYAVDFGGGKRRRRENKAFAFDRQPPSAEAAGGSIARIARLMALALRLEELVRNKTMRDYAEVARLGRVTRARMTQITKLLNLAPDIQEQILFLPECSGINERILRPVVRRIDWNEQRLIFRKIMESSRASGEAA